MFCFKSKRNASLRSLLTILATISLAFVEFSTLYIKGIDLVHRTVNVGNVNGTLHLGTFGYCLNVANNLTCSKYATDKAEIFAQVKMTNLNLKAITNGFIGFHSVALAGASVAFLSAPFSGVDIKVRIFEGFFLLVAMVFASVGFLLDIIFIAKSHEPFLKCAGQGFWFTMIAIILLLGSFNFLLLGFIMREDRVDIGDYAKKMAPYHVEFQGNKGRTITKEQAEQEILDEHSGGFLAHFMRGFL